MKSVFRKAAALGLVLVMCGTSLTGCGSKKETKIDGSKKLMTVNGEDVNLGVGSFFARFEQARLYQLYTMYFGMTSNIFDSVDDEESGTTYGETLKDGVLEDLKKMVVISQHAEEYGVSLTDEQKTQIDEAAQAYIDGNDEAVRDKIGATKEDVVSLMTMQTIQSLMMDPIVKDVDTEVSDEEAQQTSVTYIPVAVEEEEEAAEAEAASEAEAAESEAASAAEAAESEAASVAEAAESEAASVAEAAESEAASAAEAAESEAASVAEVAESEAASVAEAAESEAASAAEAAESEAAPVEETEAMKAAKASAEAVLAAVLAADDVAEADLGEIAKTVDEEYYDANGSFTTNDHSDSYLDQNVIAAVQGLEDGQVVDHVVLGEENDTYYVVRLDHVSDADATEEKKESIIRERKQDLFDETTDDWVEGSEITVDEEVWKAITLTDAEPYTLKVPETESTAEAAESAAEEAVSAAEEAESAAEDAVSAAEEAESAAEEAVSTAAEAVEDAASTAAEAAEDAVSTAADAVEDAASTAAGAAEEAVSTAADAGEDAASTAADAAEEAVSTAAEAAEDAVSAAAEAVEDAASTAAGAAEEAVSTVESAAP